MTLAELINAYEIAVQRQTDWLEALIAVFSFEPATKADADTRLTS